MALKSITIHSVCGMRLESRHSVSSTAMGAPKPRKPFHINMRAQSQKRRSSVVRRQWLETRSRKSLGQPYGGRRSHPRCSVEETTDMDHQAERDSELVVDATVSCIREEEVGGLMQG